MDRQVTVSQIARLTHLKANNEDVIKFVAATNEYRKLWPLLFKEALEHNSSKKHLEYLDKENKLYYSQKISGMKLGILTKDPDMSHKGR